MTQRYDYIDVAKGIGILLVVWAHILIVGNSHKIIYAFHMPLFFFISGMLFDPTEYVSFKSFFIRKVKRLLLPYFIYSLATWAIWAAFRFIRGDEVNSYLMPLLQTFIAQGSGAYMVHNSALWFIPCLFAVELMYFAICRVREPGTLLICFGIAGLGCVLKEMYGDSYLHFLPWNLDAAFFALPFYGVSNSIMKNMSHQRIQSWIVANRTWSSVGAALLFGGMALLALRYGICSMGSSSYQCPLWCFFLRAFLGCFAMVALSCLLCAIPDIGRIKRGLVWCGKNSLDIMCLHIPIKGVAIILIAWLLNVSGDVSSSPYLSSVAFVITMVVIVPVVTVINRFIRK